MTDHENDVHGADKAFEPLPTTKQRVFAPGVLPMLAILFVGFSAMAGAMYFERTKDHEEYIAARPPIPAEYHAYSEESAVVKDVLNSPNLAGDARVETSKFALMVPVGYGGNTFLPPNPCNVMPGGYYTELGVYDARPDDEIIDGVIVVYTRPPKAGVQSGECLSNLVFMVKPEYQMFG